MIICQVATFSPLCTNMTLKDCTIIDKQLINAYKFRMKYTHSHAKYGIFLSICKGGLGARSFTREFLGALQREIEVYISNKNRPTSHALLSSIEEAFHQQLWRLHKDGRVPTNSSAAARANCIHISGKKTTFMTI